MVQTRDGDEVDLLASSVRTSGGAVVSTTLYALSGIVYAFVTSPAATGQYFFIALTVALVLRPVRGVSQTLQKIGSERGASVSAYLGLATAFAAGYLTLVVCLAFVGVDVLTRLAVFTRDLFWLATLFAVSTALAKLVGLAVGVPIPAVYGTELGAVAGAAGYAVMNLVVCGYVAYHARDIFGSSLVDRSVALQFCLGLGMTLLVTLVAVDTLARASLSPVAVATAAAAVAIVAFATTLGTVSVRARQTFALAYRIYWGSVRSALGR